MPPTGQRDLLLDMVSIRVKPLGALGILGVIGVLVEEPTLFAPFARFVRSGVDRKIELGAG